MRIRVRISLSLIAVVVVLAAAFFAVRWFFVEVGDDIVAAEPAETPISHELKEQIAADHKFTELVSEGYQPDVIVTPQGGKDAIRFVHCATSCDTPYSRDYPAVMVDVEQRPELGDAKPIVITKVTITVPKHVDDARSKYRYPVSCEEPLTSVPTLGELRDTIKQLQGEDTSILSNDRLTAGDGAKSWRCY